MSLINALSQPPPQWSLSRDATDAPPRSGGRRAPHRAKADGRSATADRSRAARQRCARARRTTVSRARDRVDQAATRRALGPYQKFTGRKRPEFGCDYATSHSPSYRGNTAGTVDVVTDLPGNSSVHVPDLPVLSGTFAGTIDLTQAVVS